MLIGVLSSLEGCANSRDENRGLRGARYDGDQVETDARYGRLMRFIIKHTPLSALHCFRIRVKLIPSFVDFIRIFLHAYPRFGNSNGAVEFTARVTAPAVCLDRCFNQENSPSETAYLRFRRRLRNVRHGKNRIGFARLRIGLKSMWHLNVGGCCLPVSRHFIFKILFHRDVFNTSGFYSLEILGN